jgi:hypothetical protein
VDVVCSLEVPAVTEEVELPVGAGLPGVRRVQQFVDGGGFGSKDLAAARTRELAILGDDHVAFVEDGAALPALVERGVVPAIGHERGRAAALRVVVFVIGAFAAVVVEKFVELLEVLAAAVPALKDRHQPSPHQDWFG